LHIHILGICGTFMGSLAQLAVEKGIKVTGCDQNVYPPMSDQLEASGIELIQGYSEDQLDLKPDVWVVGNAMSRGNPLVEAILNRGLAYMSGPEFLKSEILKDRWVMAVAGTHGKTTTASMLAWVLEYAGFEPGYLIGGVPGNFGHSARLGKSDFFVIEADEYDTAFFDKRSKFVHYKPRTVILNNLEFDHADIFDNVKAIRRQFHHLVRIVPGDGTIIANGQDKNLKKVLKQGCWTPVQTFGTKAGKCDWVINKLGKVEYRREPMGQIDWDQLGKHNRLNALAVIASARSIGIDTEVAIKGLGEFSGVKRRMELIGQTDNCRIYDDFAHHPTAIATTLEGLRAAVGKQRIVAVIEPRSNTMKMGVHGKKLLKSANEADRVYWFQPENLVWDLSEMTSGDLKHRVKMDFDTLLDDLINEVAAGGHIVIMSNGGFMGIHKKLLNEVKLLQEASK
jgi:UDP-N-acetylmuramate: L-alanyl-gamma-D-glutamyl-meso-diaminopimelate ligase